MTLKQVVAEYKPIEDGRTYWCNSHGRQATHQWSNGDMRGWMKCCAPGLGGIMIPCVVVDLTDEAEVVA